MIGAIKIDCIGWIPSISGNIYLFEPFAHKSEIPGLAVFNVEDYTRKIDQDCLNIINKYQIRYVKGVNLSDNDIDRDEVSYFVYLLEDGEEHRVLKEILVFQGDKNVFQLIGHLEVVSLDNRGLIKLKLIKSTFINELLKAEFINLVYINIKELYHKHTHHDGDTTVADRLLPVCFTNDEKIGKKQIVKQFQKKVIFYNLEIKRHFVFSTQLSLLWNPMSSVHEIIRQATGEFIYALNFINFYEADIDDSGVYKTIFNNEISSIKTYSEEAESQYSLWLTRRITLYTIVLVVLTGILIYVTIDCGHRLEAEVASLGKAIQNLTFHS